MNKKDIRQYDYISITAIHRNFSKAECSPGMRVPKIADIAAVIEIYNKPGLGYELESVNERGETEWLITVAASDLVFEKIQPPDQRKILHEE
jgi:hypothetical protein